jgi:hypothetical protein
MAADLLSTVRSELDARLDELRPVLCEYERLLAADAALDVDEPAARPAAEGTSGAPRGRRTGGRRKRARARRGATQNAILAALEHGSHTASELVSVTALAGPSIRTNLRRLLGEGTITRTERAGRTAYALAGGSRSRV